MTEKQVVTIDTLVSWAESLHHEYKRISEKSPDSFAILMVAVSYSMFWLSLRSDEIKTRPDASLLMLAVYKQRNRNIDDDTKICNMPPYAAVEEVQFILEWGNDEYVTAQVYTAYLCCKLSLRHHLRGNFHRAAMYAENVITCTQILSLLLPVTYVDNRTRSYLARRAAIAKMAADPKQKEKKFVCECWKEWQEQPGRYKGKAAFARDMLNKCEHLESQKKIEDWCRDWEKANPAG